ncbi:MAG: RagB/SusD family nutrient uptake outer membrane protein [Bacteroidales bacterium]|nr:RagB/SusD family nutrient uptake outer membrane protein [Bacteroidales bacterium]
MRAWHQWDLLQKWGGKGSNGQMLGFPIVTDVIELDDNMDIPRNTYDECVAQIIADCDSAYKYLPIAHRDFLVPVTAERAYKGGKYWGRFDGISMRALKAMVYLTWASPRFNSGNVVARWDSAAYNAKKVIDFKLTVDKTNAMGTGFNEATGVTWTNPNFPGIVIASRYNTNNDVIERMFYPGGFQGDGRIGPTQELVDAFGMANGRPITDPLSGYDPTKPYLNRDPRFYTMIWYNTAQAKKNNTGALMYTFENWSNGGKDAAGVSQNNSLTNYHVKKFVSMGLNWSDASVTRAAHSKFFIRWAHMVLAFAEAANHVTGNPNTALYGLTPKAAIKYLRVRKTYDNTNGLSATDPYLDEVANAGEVAFDAFVKNERRIETCFEGMRFYDLRRWTTDANWQAVINKPVHGAWITKNTDNSFTYDLNFEVEPRLFQSPYLPIPYNEMLRNVRNDALVQNEGWANWN